MQVEVYYCPKKTEIYNNVLKVFLPAAVALHKTVEGLHKTDQDWVPCPPMRLQRGVPLIETLAKIKNYNFKETSCIRVKDYYSPPLHNNFPFSSTYLYNISDREIGPCIQV